MQRAPGPRLNRRKTLIGMSSVAAATLVPGIGHLAFSASGLTPRQAEGPFYPPNWMGDIDNDLVMVRGAAAEALGRVIHIEGQVLTVAGDPVPDARVEIWQCDANGVYHHPRDVGGSRQKDPKFQGRGHTVTDAAGRYDFRTIKPVPYPGRTPHVHFKVFPPGRRSLTTQMYVFGEPANARDGLLNRIRDPHRRDRLIVRLEPSDRIEPESLTGRFDIVVA